MKRSVSLVAIAAVFAIGAAFTTRLQTGMWNVDHPEVGSPGIYSGTMSQIKNSFCPGVDNLECAYFISTPSVIVKKP
jgi:hypothetical protein